jgi:hypothetical protein
MRSVCVGVWVCLAGALPVVANGQGRQGTAADLGREIERFYNLTVAPAPTDVLTGPVVTDAPFSAEATTSVTQVLGDGTRIEQRTSSRFYRDRAGRVRREQTILGLGGLNANGSLQTITVDPDPGDGFAYMLDPMSRTARRVPRMSAADGGLMAVRSTTGTVYLQTRTAGPATGIGNPPVRESLGTRQIEGVKAVGRKLTTVIPIGQIGNDRPIEITDERWESPELRMLVYSRNADPRTGVVEYRLTNINRAEPPIDLFVIPSDYAVNAPPALGGRGAREGGPGTVGR